MSETTEESFQLNSMWYTELDPRREKRHKCKKKKKPDKYERSLEFS